MMRTVAMQMHTEPHSCLQATCHTHPMLLRPTSSVPPPPGWAPQREVIAGCHMQRPMRTHRRADTVVRSLQAAASPQAVQLPQAYRTCEQQQQQHPGPQLLLWTYDEPQEMLDVAAVRAAGQAKLSGSATPEITLPPPPTVITRLPQHLGAQVVDNALVLVDKPLLWEAEEVARSLRWCLPVDKVGFAGHLDAGATGLLLILMGKATALTGILNGLSRRYTAILRLGASTDTYDSAGRPTALGPWQHITDEDISRVATYLHGRHVQAPPPLTAVRVKGKPVYDLARQTPKKDMVPRPVTVTDLKLARVEPGSRDLRLDVTFAKHGYVQSLAHEIGQRLACGAHVVAMRREAVGGFSVENAWTLEVLLPVARMVKKQRQKANKRRS